MADEQHSVEATNPILGSLKVSGANVNTIFTVAGFILTCLIGWALFTHQTEAKDSGKEVAAALKESNREMAQALKDSNKDVAEAIKQMAAEQRKANEIGKEQTCLLRLPTNARVNAEDFCRRMSRER